MLVWLESNRSFLNGVNKLPGHCEARIEQSVLGSLDPADNRKLRIAEHLRSMSPLEAKERIRRVWKIVRLVEHPVVDLRVVAPRRPCVVRIAGSPKQQRRDSLVELGVDTGLCRTLCNGSRRASQRLGGLVRIDRVENIQPRLRLVRHCARAHDCCMNRACFEERDGAL